jgi:hypothetical protein
MTAKKPTKLVLSTKTVKELTSKVSVKGDASARPSSAISCSTTTRYCCFAV